MCRPSSTGSKPSASTTFSRAERRSACASPIRSIAATSALASIGSSRAGRSNVSEYGSGSTSISPGRQHLGVDHVRAAAEVDDVEHRDVLAQLLRRDLQLLADVGDLQPLARAAGGDQHRGERDQAGEALRADRGLGAAAAAVGLGGRRRRGRRPGGDGRRRLAAVGLDQRRRRAGAPRRPAPAGRGSAARSSAPTRSAAAASAYAVRKTLPVERPVGAELALDVPGERPRGSRPRPRRPASPSCHGIRFA